MNETLCENDEVILGKALKTIYSSPKTVSMGGSYRSIKDAIIMAILDTRIDERERIEKELINAYNEHGAVVDDALNILVKLKQQEKEKVK